MATEKKIDCVILGLLSHEELTGYEIKKRMDTVLKYFWGASYGSIYPTLNDLVRRGFATKRGDAESKRNKQIYTITDDGRKYLKEWLMLPVEKDELRYETLLKLFSEMSRGKHRQSTILKPSRKKLRRKFLIWWAQKRHWKHVWMMMRHINIIYSRWSLA